MLTIQYALLLHIIYCKIVIVLVILVVYVCRFDAAVVATAVAVAAAT